MWSFDRAGLSAAFAQAACLAAVDHLEPQLYSLRHGGASADALRRTRSIEEIKKRGRWTSDASVRRYEKAALAMREERRAGEEALAYGSLIESRLGEVLMGTISAPPPPRAGIAPRT